MFLMTPAVYSAENNAVQDKTGEDSVMQESDVQPGNTVNEPVSAVPESQNIVSEESEKKENTGPKAVSRPGNTQTADSGNENGEKTAGMTPEKFDGLSQEEQEIFLKKQKEKIQNQAGQNPSETGEKQENVKRSVPQKKKSVTKTALSGIVLMPTAYRGTGINETGPGLDINAAYIIGRLYGKNTYDWTLEKKDYLDRIGIWLLSADGKLQVQTEGKFRPAVAAGVQGIFSFRDSSNPTLKTNQDLKVDAKSNNSYANAYVAVSKRIGNRFILNAGYSDGDMPKMINSFSEYLSKQAMEQNGITGVRGSGGMLFGGMMWLPKPDSPISVEFMIPQGAPMSPKLVNLHLGTLLKLNFEISYLKFRGGWDLLGVFQFRYNYWP